MSESIHEGASIVLNGSVATIVFDRKRTHNALDLRSWLAVPVLIAAAERNSIVELIVLRGAHGNFGSGNDLLELRALHGNPVAAAQFARAMANATGAVEAASKPVLVAIEGLCYGASVALALAGDVRIAASNVTFAITPAKLGAVYLLSDLHRLVAAVGSGQSKKLIYSAQPIKADRAREIGLVDEVIPSAEFETQLQLLTDAILRGSPFTLRQSKQMLRRVHPPTPQETEATLAFFVEATQGEDFLTGVDAFLMKQAPRFR